MRRGLIPFDPGRLHGARQHGLTERQAAKCRGIKGAEGMERVAFVVDPADDRIQERQVERGVVSHQYRPLAVGGM